MKYFVLFKLRENQTKHAYSVVTDEILATIPPEIILAKKELGADINSDELSKESFKILVEELGGTWYGD